MGRIQRLAFLENFIRTVHQNNTQLTSLGDMGFFFSRKNKGGIVLSKAESPLYSETVATLMKMAGKTEQLSRRGAEKLVQHTMFSALDPTNESQLAFEDRLRAAIQDASNQLDKPPKSYVCYLPIESLAKDALPIQFGEVQFIELTSQRYARLAKSKGLSARVKNLFYESKLVGKCCIRINVQAKDDDAARSIARRAARRAIDIVNFFSDVVPYNFGWMHLPEDGSSGSQDYILGTEGEPLRAGGSRYGPLMPFSFKAVQSKKFLKAAIREVQRLCAPGDRSDLAEVILTAMQWAGRAAVENKREEAFLLYAIALESLMLPVQGQELTYRLSTRTARLLAAQKESRREVQQQVTSLYRVRSSIVHSGSYEVLDVDLGILRAIAKNAVLAILLTKDVRKLHTAADLDRWFESQAGIP